jgi:hypothetical protein
VGDESISRVQRKPHELAPALRRKHCSALKKANKISTTCIMSFEGAMIKDLHGIDSRTHESRLQTGSHNLNFGKLRHERTTCSR